MRFVLAIDGGGIRGLIPARVLQYLEAVTGKFTAEMFDLIAGTSTGGILATALTKPLFPGSPHLPQYSASDLVMFYLKRGPDIFKTSLWRTIKSAAGLLDGKYPSKQLDEPLGDVMGTSWLSESVTKVLVSTYDLKARQPFFFKSHKAADPAYDFPIWQVARSTAAAPTYFDPVLVKARDNSQYPLIDGGVFATNVAMHAYAEAKVLWPNENCCVVSLGCGEAVGPYDYRRLSTGDLGWITPLLDIMFQGSSATVDYHMRQVCDGPYFRFQPQLKQASDKMDDASAANLKNLVGEAERLIMDRRGEFESLIALLRGVAAAPRTLRLGSSVG